jgi:hypothetical protein
MEPHRGLPRFLSDGSTPTPRPRRRGRARLAPLCAAAIAAFAPCGGSTAWGQLPSGELRLWLKADSLALSEGAQVKQWIDSSPYATRFAPRTSASPDGPWLGAPVEEHPHLQTVTLNGISFRTVQFERSGAIRGGNPNLDRSGSVDRLFQTNNLVPGSNPLVIADGTSVSAFTVLKPDVTSPASLGFQSVWALRGNNASLIELGISGGDANSAGRFNYVTYDSVTSYVAAMGPAGAPQPAGKWHIVQQTITEAGDNDLLAFFANSTEDPKSPLAPLLPVTNGGLIVNRNDGINEDPPGLTEPFVLGGHAQDCCGEGETFAGNIAEVIIYARVLSPQETAQVTDYLTRKYLGLPPSQLPGDYNEDGVVDAADYVVYRNHLGQFFALPNENPVAATEGFVDTEDYDFWRAHFGTAASAAAETPAIPEPAAHWLALVGAAGVGRRPSRAGGAARNAGRRRQSRPAE